MELVTQILGRDHLHFSSHQSFEKGMTLSVLPQALGK